MNLTKTLLIMKLTTILLFVACLQVSAKGYSQITISVKNAPLETVLKEIGKQSGYNFLYTYSDLEKSRTVDLNVKSATIEEVLQIIFKEQPLTYSIVDKVVVVKTRTLAIQSGDLSPSLTDITGRVNNEQGEPLAGASIIVKRTSRGDMTDAKGNFRLHNVRSDDIIEISFTGYKKQSIKVGDRTDFTLILEVAVDELDRAVIRAYGTTTRRLTTSNIEKVTAAEIERQPVINPLLALEGKIAGLEVKQTSGYASAPVKVELRGRSTIGGTFPSDPLFVIDGVPLTVLELTSQSSYYSGSTGFLQSGFSGPAAGQSPFFNINPADIESIEVLKDADATAIYGSRGANGVILITTKKGKAGKSKFDLHIQEGITKQTRYWHLLDTKQYVHERLEAVENSGYTAYLTPQYADFFPDLITWDTTRYTDWQKQLYGGTGQATDVQASLSGGNNQTNFRFGAGYNKTTNILTTTGSDQRGSVSFNLSHHSSDQKLEFLFSGAYSYTRSNMIDFTSDAVSLPPNAPAIFDSLGNLNYAGWGPPNSNGRNRFYFASLKTPYVARTNFLNSNLQISYRPVKGLEIKSSFGYNNAQADNQRQTPISSLDPATNPTGQSQFGNTNNKNWIIEPQINYGTWISKGKIELLAGATVQHTATTGVYTFGSGYVSDDLLNSIVSAPVITVTDYSGEYKYAAVFGRVTYNWSNKYLFSLNGRRDGSSRFGSGRQFGNFGSAAVVWIFSNETWFKDKVNFISFGKLRASFGTTGSDAIGDYQYLTRWSASGSFGQTYTGNLPLYPQQHANPNYQWQVNKKWERALDLGLIKDRINLSIAYYRDRCGNQLISFPLPVLTGFNAVAANSFAKVQNSGWEFTVGAKIMQAKNFTWSINVNGSLNRNKLLAYPNIDQSPYAGILEVGQPLNILKLLHYTGVDPRTGNFTFQDKNHDGTLNYDYTSPQNDLFIHDLSPKFLGGAGMNFQFKNVQLYLFFDIKEQIGQNALIQAASVAGQVGNIPVEVLNNIWHKPGDHAAYPMLTMTPADVNYYFRVSDGAYTDASYIRLSNLSLSYAFPTSYIKKIGMQSGSIFLHTNNIFTITKYKGLDPETLNWGGMPPVKTLVVGLNFNF